MVEIETQPQPVVAVLKYQVIDLSVCALISWSGSLSAQTLTRPLGHQTDGAILL